MPVNGDVREVEKYATAWKSLESAHCRLDEAGFLARPEQSPGLPPERLDEVVATLCQQARAAQHLASVVDQLCSALVAGAARPA